MNDALEGLGDQLEANPCKIDGWYIHSYIGDGECGLCVEKDDDISRHVSHSIDIRVGLDLRVTLIDSGEYTDAQAQSVTKRIQQSINEGWRVNT